MDECECGDEDCKACHDQLQSLLWNQQNQTESNYQKSLWGPDGIFWDPQDPFCQELVRNST